MATACGPSMPPWRAWTSVDELVTGCSRSDGRARRAPAACRARSACSCVIHMRVAWTSSERPRAENTSSGEPRCGVCSSSASAPGATRWWRTARSAAGREREVRAVQHAPFERAAPGRERARAPAASAAEAASRERASAGGRSRARPPAAASCAAAAARAAGGRACPRRAREDRHDRQRPRARPGPRGRSRAVRERDRGRGDACDREHAETGDRHHPHLHRRLAPPRRSPVGVTDRQMIRTGVPSGMTRAIQRMLTSSTRTQPCDADEPSGSARLVPSRPWIATRPGPPP